MKPHKSILKLVIECPQKDCQYTLPVSGPPHLKKGLQNPLPLRTTAAGRSPVPRAGPREVPGLLISLATKIAHNTPGEHVFVYKIYLQLWNAYIDINFRWFHFPLLNTSSLEWDLNVEQTVMGMRPKINIDCYVMWMRPNYRPDCKCI